MTPTVLVVATFDQPPLIAQGAVLQVDELLSLEAPAHEVPPLDGVGLVHVLTRP